MPHPFFREVLAAFSTVKQAPTPENIDRIAESLEGPDRAGLYAQGGFAHDDHPTMLAAGVSPNSIADPRQPDV